MRSRRGGEPETYYLTCPVCGALPGTSCIEDYQELARVHPSRRMSVAERNRRHAATGWEPPELAGLSLRERGAGGTALSPHGAGTAPGDRPAQGAEPCGEPGIARPSATPAPGPPATRTGPRRGQAPRTRAPTKPPGPGSPRTWEVSRARRRPPLAAARCSGHPVAGHERPGPAGPRQAAASPCGEPRQREQGPPVLPQPRTPAQELRGTRPDPARPRAGRRHRHRPGRPAPADGNLTGAGLGPVSRERRPLTARLPAPASGVSRLPAEARSGLSDLADTLITVSDNPAGALLASVQLDPLCPRCPAVHRRGRRQRAAQLRGQRLP